MEKLSLSKGKVLSVWDIPNVEGFEIGDIKKMAQNVKIEYSIGSWFQVSMNEDIETMFNELSLKRGVWNIFMMFLTILWCSFAIILAYEVNGDRILLMDGVSMGFLGWVLLMLFWISWNRNIIKLRKNLKGLLGGSVCCDVFVFCKSYKEDSDRLDLDDEGLKSRAEEYGKLLSEVNPNFIDGWFNVWYVVPKTFETVIDYDERLRCTIFSIVSNTEERMRYNDEKMFLQINKRQVGVVESDILIENL